MRTPKFIYDENGEKEITELCAKCQYSYVEDIWYEWMCKKNRCPYDTNKMSKIAGIYWDDTAAAPGISLSVYFSGCHFHCPGCHNPEAQDFNYGEDFSFEKLQEIIEKLNKNGVERRLSILGGEPLCDENLIAVQTLIDWCKAKYPNLIIYIWTGYTIEELQERNLDIIKHILDTIDVLIDGRYEEDKRDITLPLRGSSNQRIINLKG